MTSMTRMKRGRKRTGTHEYIVEGSTNLDDLNDELGLNLESDDYDSLGGFIIEHLDRLPAAGDEVTTADGVRLVVEKLDKNRIESVHVYLPPHWNPSGQRGKLINQKTTKAPFPDLLRHGALFICQFSSSSFTSSPASFKTERISASLLSV